MIQLDNENLRVVIDPDSGCNINEISLRSPDDQWHSVTRSTSDQNALHAGVGSFVMLPWTNRIKDAQFKFGTCNHTLKANHHDGTAIHGVGRDHVWSVMDRSPYSARFVLDSRMVDEMNFPMAFGAVLRVEIHAMDIEIDLEITNLGDEPMPAGAGHHPYFMRSLWDDGDELNVKAGVEGRYRCIDQIPTGAMVDDQVCADLRAGGAIGNPGLDDVFGGFDGKAVLEWDKSGVRCQIECSEAFGHLVVFTPRTEGRFDSPPLPWVCVEPVTMVNDGFNRMGEHADTGVRVLESGEAFKASMRLNFERM